MSAAAELLRDFASTLEAFGPDATEADMDPAISALVAGADRVALAGVLDVLVGALDRLRPHPTPAQGAEELRKLADELDPLVEVKIVPIRDGSYCLGDPPPFSAERTAYLAWVQELDGNDLRQK